MYSAFDAKTDKDDQFDVDGIPVVMERSHGIYLAGMEVDCRADSIPWFHLSTIPTPPNLWFG